MSLTYTDQSSTTGVYQIVVEEPGPDPMEPYTGRVVMDFPIGGRHGMEPGIVDFVEYMAQAAKDYPSRDFSDVKVKKVVEGYEVATLT